MSSSSAASRFPSAILPSSLKPLRGTRILSLALNLPGPAALLRLRAMGASCLKAEPPAPASAPSGSAGDPMRQYNPGAYADLHDGVRVISVDLKSDKGQQRLARELARTDVLLTSFRPSALHKLGLDWKRLHKTWPQLNLVAIVGAPGPRAEEPGHDLTYMAEAGLTPSLELPASLFADMGGALAASEAALQVMLRRHQTGKGQRIEIALSDAATWLGLPRHWGLTQPSGAVGGAHAGYRIYPCKNGRVAVAALEPHFAARLCAVAGLPPDTARQMMVPEAQAPIAAFLAGKTRHQLDKLAAQHDIPLHTLSA